MFDFIDEEKLGFFVGGIVAGVLGMKVVKAKKTREIAVKGLAQGFIIKDCIVEEVTNIREEAEDICVEAKFRAQEACDCECDCGCDCDCEDAE